MESVRGQITSLRPQLSTTSPAGLPTKLDTLGAGIPALKTAQVAAANYSVLLTSLNAQLVLLNAATGP
jgi:hypothetical protein